jgi:transcriptional regulator with XRE-family HTH domain
MTTSIKDRPRIVRPGSGVAVDPGRVMAMRQSRLLSRKQVSDRVRKLDLLDEHENLVTLGCDHLGKIETGHRKPSLDAMRALCDVLECKPDELMPGGPVIPVPVTARARKSRLAHNRELRAFAIQNGLRYKNSRTGRVYYAKPLRNAYAAHVAAIMADAQGDADDVETTGKLAAAALTYAMTVLRVPEEDREEDREQERLVS